MNIGNFYSRIRITYSPSEVEGQTTPEFKSGGKQKALKEFYQIIFNIRQTEI